MRREHDRDPVRPEVTDQAPGGEPGLRIQACGRLVEEDDLGPAHDCGCERETLALAAGDPAHGGPRHGPQSEPLDQDVDVERVRMESGQVAQELDDPGARVEAATLLEHDADLWPQRRAVGDRVEAEDPNGTRVRSAVALAGLDRGGLARTIGAQQRRDRGARHGEGEAIDGDRASVPL
jgi:hypothetical protein